MNRVAPDAAVPCDLTEGASLLAGSPIESEAQAFSSAGWPANSQNVTMGLHSQLFI